MPFSINKIRAKQRVWDSRVHEGEQVVLIYPADGTAPQIVKVTQPVVAVVIPGARKY